MPVPLRPAGFGLALAILAAPALAQTFPDAALAAPVDKAAQIDQSIQAAQRARLEAAMTRWQTSLDAFAAADKQQTPASGGILFVGSSSIRLWDNLETQFGEASHIVKRGFGGSRLSDCASLVTRLVVPYSPRLVVVYAGDNDLAEGATPQQVAESFSRFVENVRAVLPATRIAYVSIKPSPSRAALMEKIRTANGLIAKLADRTNNLDYIDVHSKMLDDQGQPRADLFRADHLHLNDEGYALWRSVIAEHLSPGGPNLTTAVAPAGGVVPSAAAPDSLAGREPR